MGIIIVCAAVSVIFITLTCLCIYFGIVIAGVVWGLLSCVFLIITLGLLTDTNNPCNELLARYTYEELYDRCMHYTVTEDSNYDLKVYNKLKSDVDDYNKTVEEHRRYCDSFWFGVCYSEYIAELPTIDINEYIKLDMHKR